MLIRKHLLLKKKMLLLYYEYFSCEHQKIIKLIIIRIKPEHITLAEIVTGRLHIMIGRVVNRARKTWILIISIFLLIGIALSVWIILLQNKTDIPNNGVFVIKHDKGETRWIRK